MRRKLKMRNFKTIKMAALTTVSAFLLYSGTAQAQNTITVPVTATVQNAITLTNVDPLAFATVIAINDGTQTASATIATTDAISFATTGAPALMAAATGTPTAGEITVAGVVGATINLTINNVVNPTDGTDTFTLSAFNTDVNGGGSTAQAVGVAFSHTATALDTVLIGATITTPAQPLQIGDGTYTGSFDILASY